LKKMSNYFIRMPISTPSPKWNLYGSITGQEAVIIAVKPEEVGEIAVRSCNYALLGEVVAPHDRSEPSCQLVEECVGKSCGMGRVLSLIAGAVIRPSPASTNRRSS
jgi:hypothetical protein